MTQPKKSPQPSLVHMLAPAAFLAIGYLWFFHLPLSAELDEAWEDLTELSKAEHANYHALIDTTKESKSVQAELSALEEELAAASTFEAALIDRSETLRADLTRSSRPAATMTSVIRLLEGHRLEVLKSGPMVRSNNLAEGAVSPLIKLLSEAAREQDGTRVRSGAQAASGREVYLVTLRGRFGDFREALGDLGRRPTGVLPLSIEMEKTELDPTSARDGRRTWVLVLLV